MLTAVTSHVRGLPAHQDTRVRPSGLFQSRRVRPTSSLVAGMPAGEKTLKMTSFRAWYLVVLPEHAYHAYTQNYGDHERRPWRRIDKCVTHID